MSDFFLGLRQATTAAAVFRTAQVCSWHPSHWLQRARIPRAPCQLLWLIWGTCSCMSSADLGWHCCSSCFHLCEPRWAQVSWDHSASPWPLTPHTATSAPALLPGLNPCLIKPVSHPTFPPDSHIITNYLHWILTLNFKQAILSPPPQKCCNHHL